MSLFVQFGAGNIGRSFVGKKFSEAGYDVTFVDIDPTIVDLLNKRSSYPVVVKENEKPDDIQTVRNVSALNAKDTEAVVLAVASADCIATSVGQRGLIPVLEIIAQAVILRRSLGGRPLDVIIAENLRSAAQFFRLTLSNLLPTGFPLEESVGLVETSIGKMVPIMPKAALVDDPLLLYSESYDQLIVDKKGFINPIPAISGLKAVDDICAYVDRKLFMHNMSHAAVAYLGYQHDKSLTYIWQAMQIPNVVETVREALSESAAALLSAYPQAFTRQQLKEHAEDLLCRYENRGLGDTIFRVGRDLRRKLSRHDRMVGACIMAERHELPYEAIAKATSAAFSFDARDEQGDMNPSDADFMTEIRSSGYPGSIVAATGLRKIDVADMKVIQTLAICLASR